MQIVDRNNPPVIPDHVAVCPICKATLIIEDIDEYYTGTGRVTEAGFHINCSTEPLLDGEISDRDDWWAWHFSTPYTDWLPIEKIVYEWFDKNFRINREED